MRAANLLAAIGLASAGCLDGPGDYGFDNPWDPANAGLDWDADGIANGEDGCPDRPSEAEEAFCDGVDDDCDGETDEGLTNACGRCGDAPPEVCNGVDDDCDGATDEGVTNACGVCGDAPGEVCNGVDDDCDGETDEGLPPMLADETRGACAVNVRVCAGAAGYQDSDGNYVPAPEECNGLDDDCDGETDEDFVGAIDPDAPAAARVVQICPGEFDMGSPEGEPSRGLDEVLHRVRITRPFQIRATEVTQGEWEAVMGATPSRFSECGPACPVETVSWFDAVEFCNALSRSERLEECYEIEGQTVRWPRGLDCLGWRLPTEAEWEYAARAGTTTAYHTGDGEAALGRAGWYDGNSGRRTHPVGRKEANAWGLSDMHGNVWEWVWDWYGPYAGDATDPAGPQTGDSRVRRGGSWLGTARSCRAAFRGRFRPGLRYDSLGFRPARSVSP